LVAAKTAQLRTNTKINIANLKVISFELMTKHRYDSLQSKYELQVIYMMFNFGIEHEVAFLNNQGKFADFSQTKFADFHQIVEKLPIYADDYAQLRVGDAGIKQKRWYIEGFERFADSEQMIECLPKGIEIRTTIHSDIQSTITELSESFHLLDSAASTCGFSPVLVSFNPSQSVFEPDPPLNDFELRRREYQFIHGAIPANDKHACSGMLPANQLNVDGALSLA